RELLLSSLPRHRSGIYALAQADRVEEGDRVSAEGLGRLVSRLKRHFDFVILDGVRGFDEVALQALDASDRLFLLVTQDVPSVKNGRRCLELFARLGYDRRQPRLLVNRVLKKSPPVELAAIAEHLGMEVSGQVANDYRSV